ncbi:hypothetical protein V3C99_014820 [Haemonchus contortus]
MSDILTFDETEQQRACDVFLPSATLTSWSVWDDEEAPILDRTECTLRDRCSRSTVNQRSTTLDKRGNRVFKWAEATTATSAVCPIFAITPMPRETPASPCPSCFGCGPGGCCGTGHSSCYISGISSLQQLIIAVL